MNAQGLGGSTSVSRRRVTEWLVTVRRPLQGSVSVSSRHYQDRPARTTLNGWLSRYPVTSQCHQLRQGYAPPFSTPLAANLWRLIVVHDARVLHLRAHAPCVFHRRPDRGRHNPARPCGFRRLLVSLRMRRVLLQGKHATSNLSRAGANRVLRNYRTSSRPLSGSRQQATGQPVGSCIILLATMQTAAPTK